MLLKWKIDLKGFEGYRFGDDKQLYRLPFITVDNKYRGLKKIAKNGNRWYFKINGKDIKRSTAQLKGHIILDKKPIEIKESENMPF